MNEIHPEHLSEIEKRIAQAAAVTSKLTHDFGNYLTGIMGFTELSLCQLPPEGAPYRFLQEVLQSARDGAEWIRRLRLFSARSSHPCWPTLISTVATAEEANLRAAGNPGIHWLPDLPPSLPLISLDASSLQTILAELVANACEALKGHGAIRLSGRTSELSATDCRSLLGDIRPGRYVQLTVADDGPGIPPGEQARLFHEIFFSTKPKHRGLGLMVVYGILRRFGGGFRLESANTGTVVDLFLPIADIHAPTPPRTDGPNVLVVHTDPHLLESMRRVLELHGCQVQVATSPHSALSAATAPLTSFELVVTEVQLPVLSGPDLARRILDHNNETGFVFLMPATSFHGAVEDELLQRFPLLNGPTEPRTFLQAVESAFIRLKEDR